MVIARGEDKRLKRKKKENATIESTGNPFDDVDNFTTCDDCRHNTITFDPAKDGTCSCGCH